MQRKTVLADIAVPTFTNVKMGQPVGAKLKESTNEAQPESQPDASSATEEEAREISNIVDSVLAGLKPQIDGRDREEDGKEPKKKQLVCNHREKIKLVCLTAFSTRL
jgi:hypothetical protein